MANPRHDHVALLVSSIAETLKKVARDDFSKHGKSTDGPAKRAITGHSKRSIVGVIFDEAVRPVDWTPPESFIERNGRCFELSLNCLLAQGDENISLVHGSVDIPGNGGRIPHSWVKVPSDTGESIVYDPVFDRWFLENNHLAGFNATVDEEYSKAEAISLSMKSKNKGPWHESGHGLGWYRDHGKISKTAATNEEMKLLAVSEPSVPLDSADLSKHGKSTDGPAKRAITGHKKRGALPSMKFAHLQQLAQFQIDQIDRRPSREPKAITTSDAKPLVALGLLAPSSKKVGNTKFWVLTDEGREIVPNISYKKVDGRWDYVVEQPDIPWSANMRATWADNDLADTARQEFRDLPDDALVTVYHGTTESNAQMIMETKVAQVPSGGNRGDLPTRDLSSVYVAPTHADALNYGDVVLRFVVPKKSLKASPEDTNRGDREPDIARAFFNSFDGAIVEVGHKIDPEISKHGKSTDTPAQRAVTGHSKRLISPKVLSDKIGRIGYGFTQDELDTSEDVELSMTNPDLDLHVDHYDGGDNPRIGIVARTREDVMGVYGEDDFRGGLPVGAERIITQAGFDAGRLNSEVITVRPDSGGTYKALKITGLWVKEDYKKKKLASEMYQKLLRIATDNDYVLLHDEILTDDGLAFVRSLPAGATEQFKRDHTTEFVKAARDGDGDGFIHDGTPRQRPVAPRSLGRSIRSAARWLPGDDDKQKDLALKAFGIKVPPAWKNVQVSSAPDGVNGALVKGVDTKGKTQWIYSAAHRKKKNAEKFHRIKELFSAVEATNFSANVVSDSKTDPVAGAALIMFRLGMRPGSTRKMDTEHTAYGATTLLAKHVKVRGNRATFSLVGKHGVDINFTTTDSDVVKFMKRRMKEVGGQDERLFPGVTPAKVNKYLKGRLEGKFTNKDLRTMLATGMATKLAASMDPPKSKAEFRRARMAIAVIVSAQLGNTPKEALESYINPTAFAVWDEENL